MKRILATALVLFAAAFARAEQFVPPAPSRIVIDLSGEWKFEKKDVGGAEVADFDDLKWEKVTVPHTWNAKDGQDGGKGAGGDYYRGACWYRRHVNVEKIDGKISYLKFDAANRITTAYVNGVEVGKHVGGFAAFAFDITKALKAGDNVIAVKVDNAHTDNSPPLSGDFTFFGGIYRNVSLIQVQSDVAHISVTDHGGPGVRSFIRSATPEKAEIDFQVSVTTEKDRNDVAKIVLVDAAGNIAAQAQGPANQVKMTVNKPHLWAGIPDPYLYTVHVSVLKDTVSFPFGIRTMTVDPEKGFLLNGKPYKLEGVCRHQDWFEKGWAIGKKEMDADMANFKELGLTTVRLAHYQHDQYFYDLCDREGIVVWAELALVNAINGDAFKENARQQLAELVYQNMHHPSVAMWSLANEVVYKNDNRKFGDPYVFVGELNKYCKTLDPTRQTVQAIMGGGPKEPVTDIQGFNIYMGWYYGKFEDLPKFVETHPSFSVSEYGAGGNPANHSETPKKDDHTEEFQNIFHETYWRAIRNQPHVWGTFIWAYADFASDGRTEGGFFGRNDKGLVTIDRAIKKDVFYFYKAQWSKEPFVHVTSKRFPVRGVEKIPVKIYSNAAEVELFVNGVSVGKTKNDVGIFLWPGVSLKEGENKVEAKAKVDGKEIGDTMTWTYKPGAPKSIK